MPSASRTQKSNPVTHSTPNPPTFQELILKLQAFYAERGAVIQQPYVIIGSGIRGSKLLVPGPLLGRLPAAEVVDGLGVPASAV